MAAAVRAAPAAAAASARARRLQAAGAPMPAPAGARNRRLRSRPRPLAGDAAHGWSVGRDENGWSVGRDENGEKNLQGEYFAGARRGGQRRRAAALPMPCLLLGRMGPIVGWREGEACAHPWSLVCRSEPLYQMGESGHGDVCVPVSCHI
eukprot:49510-Chlamydomonas_euryale.AAC.1